MEPAVIAFETLCWLLACGYGVMTVMAVVGVLRLRRLPPPAQCDALPDAPRVSLVIPVRDERARVAETIRRALAQRGGATEVIVVDDRSTDGTSEILGRLAEDDPRLRVVRVRELPRGWLGKCRACHLGAQAAQGEWLVFLDADSWLEPDAVARALALADSERADHVCLLPAHARTSLPGRATLLMALIFFSLASSCLQRDRGRQYIGVGAFNMVRADLYHRVGGHEALRLAVVDDVELGRLVRRAGGRTRAAIGVDAVEVEWAGTVRRFVRLLEKNGFATQQYSVLRMLAIAVIVITAFVPAAIGLPLFLATGQPGALAVFLGMHALAIPAAMLATAHGWSAWLAPLAPWMGPVLLYTGLRSAAVILRRGGVQWRDTFYTLGELRDASRGHAKETHAPAHVRTTRASGGSALRWRSELTRDGDARRRARPAPAGPRTSAREQPS